MQINLFKFTTAHKRKPKGKTYKEFGKKCNAIAKLDSNGEFVAQVLINNVETYIPFTPASFNNKDKEYIFRIDTCKNKHNICFIRNEWTAKISPGDSEHYTPIALDWIYSGKLCKFGDKTYFNVHNVETKEIIITDD